MRKPAVVAGRNRSHIQRFGTCGTAATRLMVTPTLTQDTRLTQKDPGSSFCVSRKCLISKGH